MGHRNGQDKRQEEDDKIQRPSTAGTIDSCPAKAPLQLASGSSLTMPPPAKSYQGMVVQDDSSSSSSLRSNKKSPDNGRTRVEESWTDARSKITTTAAAIQEGSHERALVVDGLLSLSTSLSPPPSPTPPPVVVDLATSSLTTESVVTFGQATFGDLEDGLDHGIITKYRRHYHSTQHHKDDENDKDDDDVIDTIQEHTTTASTEALERCFFEILRKNATSEIQALCHKVNYSSCSSSIITTKSAAPPLGPDTPNNNNNNNEDDGASGGVADADAPHGTSTATATDTNANGMSIATLPCYDYAFYHDLQGPPTELKHTILNVCLLLFSVMYVETTEEEEDEGEVKGELLLPPPIAMDNVLANTLAEYNVRRLLGIFQTKGIKYHWNDFQQPGDVGMLLVCHDSMEDITTLSAAPTITGQAPLRPPDFWSSSPSWSPNVPWDPYPTPSRMDSHVPWATSTDTVSPSQRMMMMSRYPGSVPQQWVPYWNEFHAMRNGHPAGFLHWNTTGTSPSQILRNKEDQDFHAFANLDNNQGKTSNDNFLTNAELDGTSTVANIQIGCSRFLSLPHQHLPGKRSWTTMIDLNDQEATTEFLEQCHVVTVGDEPFPIPTKKHRPEERSTSTTSTRTTGAATTSSDGCCATSPCGASSSSSSSSSSSPMSISSSSPSSSPTVESLVLQTQRLSRMVDHWFRDSVIKSLQLHYKSTHIQTLQMQNHNLQQQLLMGTLQVFNPHHPHPLMHSRAAPASLLLSPPSPFACRDRKKEYSIIEPTSMGERDFPPK
jgi:hypothetical protein